MTGRETEVSFEWQLVQRDRAGRDDRRRAPSPWLAGRRNRSLGRTVDRPVNDARVGFALLASRSATWGRARWRLSFVGPQAVLRGPPGPISSFPGGRQPFTVLPL